MDPETMMILARTRQQAFLDEARRHRLAASARRSAGGAGRSQGRAGATAWQHLACSLALGFRRVAGSV